MTLVEQLNIRSKDLSVDPRSRKLLADSAARIEALEAALALIVQDALKADASDGDGGSQFLVSSMLIIAADDLLDRENTASAEHEWTDEELRANAREEGF